MDRTVLQNKKGMTLIEVLVAFVVFLVVALAVLQMAVLSVQVNLRDILRDEAVRIAEAQMIKARNTPFADLSNESIPSVTRNFRGATAFSYQVDRQVEALGTDDKRVTVAVTWSYKGSTNTHRIMSIVRRT